MPLNTDTATREEIQARMGEIRAAVRSNCGRVEALDRQLDDPGADRDAIVGRQNALIAQNNVLLSELGELEANGGEPTAPRPRAQIRDDVGGGRVTDPDAAAAPGREIGRSGGRRNSLTGARTYTELFGRGADTYAGRFESFGAFALAVAGGRPDGRLMNATMTEGEGAGGGFLVPIQFVGALLDDALTMEKVRPYANVVPLTARSANVPIFDYSDGTSSARAGLSLRWGAEATALPEQKAKIADLAMNSKKASIFARVSAELAEDAPLFDKQLSAAMREAVAAGLDAVFLNGTGAGQPLGVLNSGALISVTKESGQSGTLLLQNLAKIAGRLSPASFGRARWLVHPTVVPSLYGMSYTVKNVAGTENVGGSYVQAITQDASGELRIFGRPVDVSDACAPLGTVGDVILADWSRYVIALRKDVTIARDTSRYFDSDELAFKLILRLDAQPQDQAAMKLRDGTNTVSPFVTVETR
jgi:HK97 family phage major capsid protein